MHRVAGLQYRVYSPTYVPDITVEDHDDRGSTIVVEVSVFWPTAIRHVTSPAVAELVWRWRPTSEGCMDAWLRGCTGGPLSWTHGATEPGDLSVLG